MKLCIFGSARESLEDSVYRTAFKIGAKASSLGYSVITGAGPGIMESANKGCFRSGGISEGARINLPFEQTTNDYIHILEKFDTFSERKDALIKESDAFVVMPGGFGTLDELFEILTLIQCKKMDKKPIILVGVKFWQPMVYFIINNMMNVTISRDDVELFQIVDTADEVLELLSMDR